MPGISPAAVINSSGSKADALNPVNHNGRNQTFVLKTNGEFTYEDRPMPPLKTDKHVLVAVHSTGLCGSDVSRTAHSRHGR